ncbi:MAG: Hpt domain-containing protein [Candidatus Sumerlaeia bacterium]
MSNNGGQEGKGLEAPISMERLHTMSAGKPAFLKRLVLIFETDTTKRLQKIQDALGQEGFSKISDEAHTLKGAFANMGASPLNKVALNMEKAAKAGDRKIIEDSLGEMKQEFAKALDYLKQNIPT